MPTNNTPYEVISAPFEIYVTTGTDAFTSILSTPSGGWALLGTNGSRNQAEGGVTVEHQKTFNKIRTEGHTGPVKAIITEEELLVRATLLDLSPNTYKHALSGDAPFAQGTTGYDVGLSHGESVREVKIMIRGVSPSNDQRVLQYEIPRGYFSGSQSVMLSKTGPAALELEITALDHMAALTTGARFGRMTVAY